MSIFEHILSDCSKNKLCAKLSFPRKGFSNIAYTANLAIFSFESCSSQTLRPQPDVCYTTSCKYYLDGRRDGRTEDGRRRRDGRRDGRTDRGRTTTTGRTTGRTDGQRTDDDDGTDDGTDGQRTDDDDGTDGGTDGQRTDDDDGTDDGTDDGQRTDDDDGTDDGTDGRTDGQRRRTTTTGHDETI